MILKKKKIMGGGKAKNNIAAQPATIKQISVKSCSATEIVDIDTAIFDDPYMEAATRVIEKNNGDDKFKITLYMEVWDKDMKVPLTYNTYLVMVNAALYKKAEIFRAYILKKYNVDLQKESLKAKNKNEMLNK